MSTTTRTRRRRWNRPAIRCVTESELVRQAIAITGLDAQPWHSWPERACNAIRDLRKSAVVTAPPISTAVITRQARDLVEADPSVPPAAVADRVTMVVAMIQQALRC